MIKREKSQKQSAVARARKVKAKYPRVPLVAGFKTVFSGSLDKEEIVISLGEGLKVLSKALVDLPHRYKEDKEFLKEVEAKVRKGVRRTNGIDL
jgi:hypothetical protein